jgi:hypothetical protein
LSNTARPDRHWIHGGLWNGPGINSRPPRDPTLAVGYSESPLFSAFPVYSGEYVDSTAVLMRLTKSATPISMAP